MALQHTLLLALALTAVAVINCTEDDKKPASSPVTPSSEAPQMTTPSAPKGSCNKTQRETIAKTWTSILTCFSHLVKGEDGDDKCKTNDHILKFDTPLLEALMCAFNPTAQGKIKTNIGTVLSMMNTTVADYKILVTNNNFSTCVKNNKDELKKCVTKVKPTNGTADQLGNFTVSKNILGLDFKNKGGLEELKIINNCVKDVWNKNKDCKQVLDFTETLFDIAEKTAGVVGGASMPISSLVVMIAASLFALYF